MNLLTLSTPRLTLRLVNASDLQNIHALHSLPETDRFNTLGIPENLEVTQRIVNGWINDNEQEKQENYFFAVQHQEQFIGLAALKLNAHKYRSGEVWYKLHPQAWGKGYATEAVKALVQFGFKDLKLHRIEAGCAVENTGSVKVLEKCGMLREGRKRLALPLSSGWSDCFEYGIVDTDL